jgi:hypothetical protein
MFRVPFAVVALALFPLFAHADGPKQAVAPGEAKPARSEVQSATFFTPSPAQAALMPGYNYYGRELQAQLWWDRHNCAPDGCPTPIGCGNAWTEKKFVFGSCRQFFGTAESSIGKHYNTRIREK